MARQPALVRQARNLESALNWWRSMRFPFPTAAATLIEARGFTLRPVLACCLRSDSRPWLHRANPRSPPRFIRRVWVCDRNRWTTRQPSWYHTRLQLPPSHPLCTTSPLDHLCTSPSHRCWSHSSWRRSCQGPSTRWISLHRGLDWQYRWENWPPSQLVDSSWRPPSLSSRLDSPLCPQTLRWTSGARQPRSPYKHHTPQPSLCSLTRRIVNPSRRRRPF